MILRRLVLRTVLRWQTWRADRAFPERKALKAMRADARKHHRPIRHIERALRNLVTDALKRETEARQ